MENLLIPGNCKNIVWLNWCQKLYVILQPLKVVFISDLKNWFGYFRACLTWISGALQSPYIIMCMMGAGYKTDTVSSSKMSIKAVITADNFLENLPHQQ